MCGIAGILNFNGEPVDSRIVKKMTDEIAHRGPDGEGIWTEGTIGLGHRRLSIIDLSEKASQPMQNDDRGVVITFNGEIYNYKELIPEIEQKGFRLFSHSDTEVILKFFEIYGIRCLDKLRGMFAFAIWDKKQQALFIVRDRVGIKPLYYLKNSNHFVFASEIKAILASGLSAQKISPSSLSQYLRNLTVPQPQSIFEDIYKLEPGSYIIVHSDGRLEKHIYWAAQDFIADSNRQVDERRCIEQLDTLLRESISYHMVADVPVGAFLSGGLDSSSVVSMMRNNYPDLPVSSFSIVFPGMPEYDEGRYASAVSELMSTAHNAYPFNENFLDDFSKIVWHLDEPFAVSSAFATYYLAQGASQKNKVVLTGDGGDELFAGYEGYKDNTYLKYSAWLLFLFSKAYSTILSLEKSMKSGSRLTSRLLTGLGRRSGSEGLRYSEQTAQNGQYPISLVIKREAFLDSLKYWEQNLTAYYYDALQTGDKLAKKLYADFMTRLVDEMLMKVDRMTMAHSLEARVPLLDHKLVEFAFSLPSNLKLHGSGLEKSGKYIFKKTLQKYLPADIIYRDKQGFNIPVSRWMQGDFLREISDKIFHGFLAKNGVLDKDGLEQLIREKDRPYKYYDNMLMLLYTFETWINVCQEKYGPVSFQ